MRERTTEQRLSYDIIDWQCNGSNKLRAKIGLEKRTKPRERTFYIEQRPFYN